MDSDTYIHIHEVEAINAPARVVKVYLSRPSRPGPSPDERARLGVARRLLPDHIRIFLLCAHPQEVRH